jgi:hypothetical protein
MLKSIWLSYDLGVRGDYQSLYQWLDQQEALECGDSVAYMRYSIDANLSDDGLASGVYADIKRNVNLKKFDRLYLIWKDGDKIKGKFLHGNRKAAPWAGFAGRQAESDEV